MPHHDAIDIGNLHVIDYYLYHQCFLQAACYKSGRSPLQIIRDATPAERFDREDWSRYDGELL